MFNWRANMVKGNLKKIWENYNVVAQTQQTSLRKAIEFIRNSLKMSQVWSNFNQWLYYE